VGVLVLVLVGGGLVLARRGDEPENPSPSASTTTTTSGSTESTTPAQADEAAAEAVVRTYFQGILDKDCEAIVASASQNVFAEGSTDTDPMHVCEVAASAGMFDFEGYSLDGLEVIGNDGDTISFTAYEMLDGTGYTETIVVTNAEGPWKIDRIV
jgi:hypothetical protein